MYIYTVKVIIIIIIICSSYTPLCIYIYILMNRLNCRRILYEIPYPSFRSHNYYFIGTAVDYSFILREIIEIITQHFLHGIQYNKTLCKVNIPQFLFHLVTNTEYHFVRFLLAQLVYFLMFTAF